MREAISKTITLFFKTTTLHGFKYLYQGCYYDRVAWAACCVASACCAGALCGVVWARFLQVPAILALQDLRAHAHHQPRMPLIALCPTHAVLARQVVNYLSLDPKQYRWLSVALSKLLRKRNVHGDQLIRLDNLFNTYNTTVKEVLLNSLPACGNLVRKCRWQNRMVPCDALFLKKTTKWGACCLLEPERLALLNESEDMKMEDLNERLFFALDVSMGVAHHTSDKSQFNSFEIMTKYDGEDWLEPATLLAGRHYYGLIRFTAVRDPALDSSDSDDRCEADPHYSHSRCIITCQERKCGCSDPLRLVDRYDSGSPLPVCSVLRMKCLKAVEEFETISCSCKPSCGKQNGLLGLESAPLNGLQYVSGPMFDNLNPQTSILVNIFVRIGDSRLFERWPTESWLTLLSSLGGVFNMFLGVGLFSALEILFLLFVRLPLALKHSAELDKPPSAAATNIVFSVHIK